MPSGVRIKDIEKKHSKGGVRPGSGQKKIKLDWDFIDKYLSAGCSGVQIAAVLGIHEQTLYKNCMRTHKVHFGEYLLSKREKGNANLLGKQYQVAMEGDKAMLIWLGKNRCNQSEKFEAKVEAKHEIIQKRVLVIPRPERLLKNE